MKVFVPSEWKDKNLELCFGAATHGCQVWINGTNITLQGGYAICC